MAPSLPGRGLITGLGAPLSALGFLWRHKGIIPLALAPFLINLALFILFFYFSYTRFSGWVESFLPVGQGWWWTALFYLLVVLMVALLLMVEIYLFAVVGNLVASPFLELLTRRVERLAGGQLPSGEGGLGALFAEMGRVAWQQLKKMVLFLLVLLALLLLNLLPGLGTLLYAVLGWLVTCFFLVLEFMDYPLDRRGLSLGAKLRYVLGLGGAGLGLGTSLFVLGLVPVINLVFLPLGAVGATLIYVQRPLPGPSAPKP